MQFANATSEGSERGAAFTSIGPRSFGPTDVAQVFWLSRLRIAGVGPSASGIFDVSAMLLPYWPGLVRVRQVQFRRE